MVQLNTITPSTVLNDINACQKHIPAVPGQKRNVLAGLTGGCANRGKTTVGKLLKAYQPMPLGSILLGQCADGLPILLDLANPVMGAILICCEEGFGKTHQLQVMVESALQTHSPSSTQIAILTLNPDEWTNLKHNASRQRYLKDVYAWHDGQVDKTIQALTDLADARRQRTQKGPNILFILDDINFVEELSYESQINLRWLLEYGSQSGVWLIGTINARYAATFRYWIEPFRTRVLGRVLSADTVDTLSMGLGPHVAALEAGSFQVYSGKAWVNYRLLPLGD